MGELFKLHIITEIVIKQVLSNLLDKNVNDNTVEAAIKLMANIGLTLEKRIAESTQKYPEKTKKLTEMSNTVYERLKEIDNLKSDNQKYRVSQRIKILIQNLLKDR